MPLRAPLQSIVHQMCEMTPDLLDPEQANTTFWLHMGRYLAEAEDAEVVAFHEDNPAITTFLRHCGIKGDLNFLNVFDCPAEQLSAARTILTLLVAQKLSAYHITVNTNFDMLREHDLMRRSILRRMQLCGFIPSSVTAADDLVLNDLEPHAVYDGYRCRSYLRSRPDVESGMQENPSSLLARLQAILRSPFRYAQVSASPGEVFRRARIRVVLITEARGTEIRAELKRRGIAHAENALGLISLCLTDGSRHMNVDIVADSVSSKLGPMSASISLSTDSRPASLHTPAMHAFPVCFHQHAEWRACREQNIALLVCPACGACPLDAVSLTSVSQKLLLELGMNAMVALRQQQASDIAHRRPAHATMDAYRAAFSGSSKGFTLSDLQRRTAMCVDLRIAEINLRAASGAESSRLPRQRLRV